MTNTPAPAPAALKLRYGNGTQLAEVLGESPSGKHWLIRRFQTTRGSFAPNPGRIAKNDSRVLDFVDRPEFTEAVARMEAEYEAYCQRCRDKRNNR